MTSSDPTRSWSMTLTTSSVSSGKDTVSSNTLKGTVRHTNSQTVTQPETVAQVQVIQTCTDSPNVGLSCLGMYRSLVSRLCCPTLITRYGSALPFGSVGARLVAWTQIETVKHKVELRVEYTIPAGFKQILNQHIAVVGRETVNERMWIWSYLAWNGCFVPDDSRISDFWASLIVLNATCVKLAKRTFYKMLDRSR